MSFHVLSHLLKLKLYCIAYSDSFFRIPNSVSDIMSGFLLQYLMLKFPGCLRNASNRDGTGQQLAIFL
ncbi:hypothetical protein LOK49_LG02G00291 [Camellia lanceoleosa]|uniref:Uncharacterized protein n=1 Tax=Camellia lanceoleosa TaxID=1840588 RepID=A0ACC0IP67_9ERIC|nr:hypothetical protein LOK49_LG02G00291 [Camellia lanceoleosa]